MSRVPQSFPMRGAGTRLCAGVVALGLLAACEDGSGFNLKDTFKPRPKAEASADTVGASSTTVERDVEAPDVFSASEPGLWDGRPSLGGVWVAHPDVTDPERVMIRNQGNGKFVVGALFRREREIPGPRLQISSDAAEALGVLAGAPVELNVTALRKEVVAEAPTAPMEFETLEAPAEIAETSLDPIAAAGAAIDNAAPTPETEIVATPEPPAAPPRQASSLTKPYIQIGIFSVEENAERAAKQMRGAGVVPTVKKQEANGKPFWRVIVGPANSASERTALLDTIKGEGFSDAYAVTN